MTQHAEHLERQHRQNAGHQVEDQPAQQRETQDHPQRPTSGIQRIFEFRRQGWKAVHEDVVYSRLRRQVERDQCAKDGTVSDFIRRRADAQFGNHGVPAVPGKLDLRIFKKDQRRALDEQVGLDHRPIRFYRHAQAYPILDRDEHALFDGHPNFFGRHRHPCPVPVDQGGKGRRVGGTGGNIQRQQDIARDTYLLAGQVVDLRVQADRLAGACQCDIQRKDNLFLVTHRLDAEDFETGRGRPKEFHLAEAV